MFEQIRSFAANESGATAIEYGLIAALISVAGITAFQQMGGSIGIDSTVGRGTTVTAAFAAENS